MGVITVTERKRYFLCKINIEAEEQTNPQNADT